MLLPKLDKQESVFRNEAIFAADVKSITLDNVLVTFFMLMRNNGSRIGLKTRNKFHKIDSLQEYFNVLEKKGQILWRISDRLMHLDLKREWKIL